jgi:hypothetical protein
LHALREHPARRVRGRVPVTHCVPRPHPERGRKAPRPSDAGSRSQSPISAPAPSRRAALPVQADRPISRRQALRGIECRRSGSERYDQPGVGLVHSWWV